jgi:pimeloyl-ACP methyl ester carboxylesterase/AraC-like DNA-binding protein
MKPVTKYTKSGRINIAYQVFGSGSADLVYIPGWVSNIDWMWNCPELVNFLQELGKVARVILFDKRGTGLSDRIIELSTLEERMDDIRAVMDAVGSEKAILFGHSEGGSVSALFAATYPERTTSLMTFGIFAKRRYAKNYPWAPTDKERQVVYDMIETSWGSGDMGLESLAPSKANDRVFMDWMANYFRSGASPSAALLLTKMNTEVDIIDILGSITVPSLIMQRTHDIDVKIEEGRFIAGRIPNATFVELEGSDHMFWVGNTEQVLNEIRTFITNTKTGIVYKRRLYTIGAVRIISDDRPTPDQQAYFSQYVAQHEGKIVQEDGQTFIANFEGPSRALNCAVVLIEVAKSLKAQIIAGIHIKESATYESDFISNETLTFIESMFEQAKPNQILITQTTKYLLVGSGLSFSLTNKPIFEPISGEPHFLFSLDDELSETVQSSNFHFDQLPKNNSFLERVLQSIDAHMEDELFGVEKLCKEIGVSDRQLQRKLKLITSKSPNQLISSIRLHRAKELLLQNNHNISEVAYQTGFSNPSYFSKSFKKEFGLTPSDFILNFRTICL